MDVEPGRFEPERFRALARTCYDMAPTVFTCHKSVPGADIVCAGFLLSESAYHNLTVRMGMRTGSIDFDLISNGGFKLFDYYREMAEANGVDSDDPVLGPCR